MKWVIHEHVARHSHKPSISESSVYSAVQPPQRSLLPLRLIILISVFFSAWAVAGLGICVPTLPCALPLNRLNHGRCFLCGNADAQTVLEDFLFSWFHLCSFCSLPLWPQCEWLTEGGWEMADKYLCGKVAAFFIVWPALDSVAFSFYTYDL